MLSDPISLVHLHGAHPDNPGNPFISKSLIPSSKTHLPSHIYRLQRLGQGHPGLPLINPAVLYIREHSHTWFLRTYCIICRVSWKWKFKASFKKMRGTSRQWQHSNKPKYKALELHLCSPEASSLGPFPHTSFASSGPGLLYLHNQLASQSCLSTLLISLCFGYAETFLESLWLHLFLITHTPWNMAISFFFF